MAFHFGLGGRKWCIGPHNSFPCAMKFCLKQTMVWFNLNFFSNNFCCFHHRYFAEYKKNKIQNYLKYPLQNVSFIQLSLPWRHELVVVILVKRSNRHHRQNLRERLKNGTRKPLQFAPSNSTCSQKGYKSQPSLLSVRLKESTSFPF